jgi:uncharacterized protein (TIGR03083 family)
MQLSPRYEGPVLIEARPGLADPATPLLRQRSRLADLLATFEDDQWAAPTRCDGWSVQDVVAHLASTNQFWTFSIDAGLAGTPTTFLATFDPVATPQQLVEAARSASPADALASFVETNQALADAVGRVDGRWDTVAEAPPGHLALALVAQHALWDGWVHERDIVIPLGLDAVVEHDEVAAALTYAAALSPAFAASLGSTREGVLVVRATDPDLDVVVEAGSQVVVTAGPVPADAVAVEGDAVALLEAFSIRAPFPSPLDPDDRWLLAGLEQVFDVAS